MKKFLAYLLTIVITATAAISGTVAYFTDEDSAVNVMTVGNVQITQNEQERIDHTNVEVGLQDFTQNQSIVPAADVTGVKTPITVNGYHLNIRTGETYVDKIVSVTNNGVNDAYVRTIFAFPEAGEFDTTTDASEQWLHWNGVSDTDTTPANGWMWGKQTSAGNYVEWPGNAEGWDVVENVEIMGKKYDIYVATNKNVIAPDESTSPSLMGFFLDTRVDYDGTDYIFTDKNGKEWNLGNISKLDILVASQAVQTGGFADAWTALDAAFGDITKDNHPWSAKSVSNYKELKAAFAEGGEIILTEDIAFEEIIVMSAGNEVYLNMNGKTITAANSSVDPLIDMKTGSSLVIDGDGTVDLDEYKAMSFILPRGDVTIKNGTFLRVAGDNASEYGSFFVGISGGKGKFVIEDGYFDFGYYKEGDCFENCRRGLNLSWGQYVRVYGGTFVGQNPAWGDEGMASLCPHCESTYCQGVFLEGQTKDSTELPEGYTITEGTTSDGRPTYTVNYNN